MLSESDADFVFEAVDEDETYDRRPLSELSEVSVDVTIFTRGNEKKINFNRYKSFGSFERG